MSERSEQRTALVTYNIQNALWTEIFELRMFRASEPGDTNYIPDGFDSEQNTKQKYCYHWQLFFALPCSYDNDDNSAAMVTRLINKYVIRISHK